MIELDVQYFNMSIGEMAGLQANIRYLQRKIQQKLSKK